MDAFGGSPKEAAIKAFRECLSKYKHEFNKLTTSDVNRQDTADANEVLRLIDNLYRRVYNILAKFKSGSEPSRPGRDMPVEYTIFTDGHLEYLYKDREAVDEFLRYLDTDLRKFPFTYEIGIIESYNGMPVESPIIVSNREES
jgi:hypothetical protein